MAMSSREAKWMRQTRCMTFKRAVRTGRALARKSGKPVPIYNCGRTADCYRVGFAANKGGGTWCVWHTDIRPRGRELR